MSKITYRSSGVNIDAGKELVRLIKPMVQSTARPGADADIGGFAGMFDPKAAGFEDPLFMAATDGVGSKLKIAILCKQYDTIGIDLVAMCVNDLLVHGVYPLVFLDYYACGKLKVVQAELLIKGIVDGCRQAGCALIGGETAEMPGIYNKKDFDLAGFAIGAIERDSLLPEKSAKAGDVLIGLPSSGLHSNGYSLVRHFLGEKKIKLHTALPFDKKQTWGDFLLTPTRIYVNPILKLLKEHNKKAPNIKAMCHITGGGIPENLPRVLPSGVGADIDLRKAAKALPVFRYFYEQGIDEAELLRTFNCGIGYILVVKPESADAVIKSLRKLEQSPIKIGRLCKGDIKIGLF